MGIFDKRVAFKPYEYPKALDFVDVLQSTFWTHKEFNFTQDIQDFKVNLNDYEREVIRRCLLAISQIEVSVKTFWSKLYEHFPKSEFNSLGVQLAFNELVHERAYSEILEILGLNSDFDKLLQVPEIQGRVDYLGKYLSKKTDDPQQSYALNITLFSLLVENVSLFSQFLIVKSFNSKKNYFKGVDNVISASMLEEDVHANVGAWIISIIRKEYPSWFDDKFEKIITNACKKAFDSEVKIVDWIMQGKDLSWLPKDTIVDFLKHRFNKSMTMIGLNPIFPPTNTEEFDWFELELKVDRHTDFFNKRPTTYSRDTNSVTAEDLF